MRRHMGRIRLIAALLFFALGAAACQVPLPKELAMNDSSPRSGPHPASSRLSTLIPKPIAARAARGTFTISASTQIAVAPETDAVRAIGEVLAQRLRPVLGYALPVVIASAESAGQIVLTTVDADPALGEEG